MHILGTKVDSTEVSLVLSKIENFIQDGYKFFITTPNPEILLKAYKDKKLRQAINGSDIAIADGVGLKLARFDIKILKGRELMLKLFGVANDFGWKVYLLGGATEINKKVLGYVQKNYPNIKVLGEGKLRVNNTGDPVDDKNLNIEKSVIKEVNNFKPQLMFVGFGAPKQELWCAKNLPGLSVGGAIVVGGSYDYVLGRQIPGLVEKLGLEWLWRLAKDPKRLGRILNALVVFPATLFVSKLK